MLALGRITAREVRALVTPHLRIYGKTCGGMVGSVCWMFSSKVSAERTKDNFVRHPRVTMTSEPRTELTVSRLAKTTPNLALVASSGRVLSATLRLGKEYVR